jgi:Protein of unknown function (DUF2934)
VKLRVLDIAELESVPDRMHVNALPAYPQLPLWNRSAARSDNPSQQSRWQPLGITMNSLDTNRVSHPLPQPWPATSSPLPDNLDLAKSREALIRDTAYVRSARRGFTPGGELEDWLAAEQQVGEFLARKIPVGFYG